jgi:hypothetical protein
MLSVRLEYKITHFRPKHRKIILFPVSQVKKNSATNISCMGPFNVLLIISRFRSDSLDPGYETLTNKGPRRGGPAPPPPPPPAGDVTTAPVTSRSYGPRSFPPDSGRYGGGGYGGREPGYESLADLRDPDYESVITGAGRKNKGGSRKSKDTGRYRYLRGVLRIRDVSSGSCFSFIPEFGF